MKIKSIEVVNFKAIQHQEINLDGYSAIVTGANNKGKSSLLRGLIDRFHGEKPNIVVKNGEEKGSNEIELTDGSKINWSFTEKTEKISFTTADEIKMTTGVISAIGYKYFGIKFDIDKFIRSSKKEALKMVQDLLGIDLSSIEERYTKKYAERAEANKDFKRIAGLNKQKPTKIECPDIDALKRKKEELIAENTKIKESWIKENEEHQKEAIKFNETQDKLATEYNSIFNQFLELEKLRGEIIGSFIDFKGIEKYIKEIPQAKERKIVSSLPEPPYHDFKEIDQEIEKAFEDKAKFDNYERELKEYNEWVEEGTKARQLSDKLNAELNSIIEERIKMLKEANLPEEFEITDDGLLYNGMVIDNNQLSSSSKYICALKLGALGLGKIRTMHFDCSFLDKNSLNEIMEWAESQDLQLLIEKPSWEGGEITYDILSKE